MGFVSLLLVSGRKQVLASPLVGAWLHRTRVLRSSARCSPLSAPLPPPSTKPQQQPTEGSELAALVQRLDGQLERVIQKAALTEGAVQQQVAQVALMQRQQVVLERRIAALEEESLRAQRHIAETTRIASDVALQHHSVDALVRQMEKLVLSSVGSPTGEGCRVLSSSLGGSNTQPSARGEEKQPEEDLQIGVTGVSTTMNAMPSAPSYPTQFPSGLPPSPPSNITDSEGQVAELSSRLEALQARVEQLTAEKLLVNNLHPNVQCSKPAEVSAAVSRAASKALGSLQTGSDSSGCGSTSAKELAALLRNTGAFPFKDNAGVTRISSQKVVVRGVPVNVGASEIRDMFSRVGPVVSCVVGAASVPSGKASSRSNCYRSQQHSEECESETEGSEPPTRRAAQADRWERTFEVTFLSVEHAVRAVLEFDGYRLRSDCVLSVVPSVSVDILTAVRELQKESKGS